MPEEMYVCGVCNSTKLAQSTYVDFNTREEIEGSADNIWCDDCFDVRDVKLVDKKGKE